MHTTFDVIIIGAGAAGLMCAIEAAARGRRVLILEKTNKPGKKILMSGGGRCNFTNMNTSSERFISHNPHFCKSALSRYTQWDFIEKVKSHHIPFYEKTLGQLFCVDKSARIVDMLLAECNRHNVTLLLNQNVSAINKEAHFNLISNERRYVAESIVVATGGLSIPTLGSSPLGYQIAQQFEHRVFPTRAGLVPLTLHDHDKLRYETLSGISIESLVNCSGQSFKENILFTHRGLSGPAMLQISSYWQPGEDLEIQFLPDIDWREEFANAQKKWGDISLKNVLAKYLAKRIGSVLFSEALLDKPLKQINHQEWRAILFILEHWRIKPNGTEGYRTAEVTLGGVDCDEISSKTFESKKTTGLYFVGEVLDVAGWLGGYNFQWAWSSGWAAGQVV